MCSCCWLPFIMYSSNLKFGMWCLVWVQGLFHCSLPEVGEAPQEPQGGEVGGDAGSVQLCPALLGTHQVCQQQRLC